ncbi:sulfate adenylyltransferase subunit CysD [Candidatus Parcubacteria bacterium]|nr:MAG: sulfate adenylyltransferase subunit CysD [Candidatus Parcubacteria bacterium]
MANYSLSHLEELEQESIYILREVAAEFQKPVLLYSIGKDSSVLLRLTQKAFYPAPVPFPLLHIDTGFKFREMIEFRDYYTQKIGAKLIVYKNKSPEALSFGPEDAHTDAYIYHKKTKPLLDAIKKYNFDAAIGGARRDEEKSRAKERVFSHRTGEGVWDPKNQRPELWNKFNPRLGEGETMRVFPLSNWTEIDIWHYIKKENIEIVPLYFAQRRKVVERGGTLYRIDEFVKPLPGEEVKEEMVRYRSLGCSPSTGAIRSTATTIDEIIAEVLASRTSERGTRAIDTTQEAAMEAKKKEGYF